MTWSIQVACQRCAKFLRKAVGEIVLTFVAAEILEGQHGHTVSGGKLAAAEKALSPCKQAGRARERRAANRNQCAAAGRRMGGVRDDPKSGG